MPSLLVSPRTRPGTDHVTWSHDQQEHDLTDSRGATVLATGANGGLGAELVSQALARGAVRSTRRPVRRAVGTTRASFRSPLDATGPESVRAAAAAAADTTMVVNKAGASGTNQRLRLRRRGRRAMFVTNVFGALRVAEAFAPVLAANGGVALVGVHPIRVATGLTGGCSGSKAAFWSPINPLRLELAPQGTQVVGAHLGYTGAPMIAAPDVARADPADIVASICDPVASGRHEVLADQISREVRAGLSGPLEALHPSLV